MRIHSISTVLMVPCAIVIAYMGYKTYVEYDWPYLGWTLLPLAVLVMLYLFKPQIDYHWHTYFPLTLDDELKIFLKKKSPYYASLEGEVKEKFENRLALYIEGREFLAVGSEKRELPYDIKALISCVPIELTMHEDDFLIGDMDRIFTYKHPFPTPRMSNLHTVETNIEDGTLIFSLESFNLVVEHPKHYYNIVWHGYMEVYLKLNRLDLDDIEEYANWEFIYDISKMDEEYIKKNIGFPALDPMVTLCVLFFTHKEELISKNQIAYEKLGKIFS